MGVQRLFRCQCEGRAGPPTIVRYRPFARLASKTFTQSHDGGARYFPRQLVSLALHCSTLRCKTG